MRKEGKLENVTSAARCAWIPRKSVKRARLGMTREKKNGNLNKGLVKWKKYKFFLGKSG